MPILELSNHSRAGADFDVGPDHVGVTGRCGDGEVLLRYSVADSWQRFIQYGFVSEERPAYSLPMEIRPRRRLVIGHDAAAGQPRNGYFMPRMTLEPERSPCPTSCSGIATCRMARAASSLRRCARRGRPAGDRVRQDRPYHRRAFLRLQAAVEDEDGAAAAIRRLGRLQLEALSPLSVRGKYEHGTASAAGTEGAARAGCSTMRAAPMPRLCKPCRDSRSSCSSSA